MRTADAAAAARADLLLSAAAVGEQRMHAALAAERCATARTFRVLEAQSKAAGEVRRTAASMPRARMPRCAGRK